MIPVGQIKRPAQVVPPAVPLLLPVYGPAIDGKQFGSDDRIISRFDAHGPGKRLLLIIRPGPVVKLVNRLLNQYQVVIML